MYVDPQGYVVSGFAVLFVFRGSGVSLNMFWEPYSEHRLWIFQALKSTLNPKPLLMTATAWWAVALKMTRKKPALDAPELSSWDSGGLRFYRALGVKGC